MVRYRVSSTPPVRFCLFIFISLMGVKSVIPMLRRGKAELQRCESTQRYKFSSCAALSTSPSTFVKTAIKRKSSFHDHYTSKVRKIFTDTDLCPLITKMGIIKIPSQQTRRIWCTLQWNCKICTVQKFREYQDRQISTHSPEKMGSAEIVSQLSNCTLPVHC